MRLAGLVVVVVACGHPAAAPEPEPGPGMCGPQCSETCGNNRIDGCFLGCEPSAEECDGTTGANCTDYGYYGGAGVCTNCTFDGDACNACAVRCVDVPTYVGSVLAASKTNLAVAHETALYGPSVLTVLDASLNEVATAQLTYVPVGMVAVPDGWLVVELNDPALLVQHVDAAGTVTSQPQPIGDCGTFAGVAYGPGGRALVLCDQFPTQPLEPGPAVVAVIVDASGAVAVQPFDVYAPQFATFRTVTTDGTSFFVAAGGQLAVVASDGTISSRITGYPTEVQPQSLMMIDAPVVSWSGSSGWYVVPSDGTQHSYTAQAFDATGAMVRSPVSISTMNSTTGLQAFNTGLIGTSIASPSPPQSERPFAIARIDATGAVVATTEVGVVGFSTSVVGLPATPSVESFGSGVAVAWRTANTAHVALVTP